jgi:hypothetical protein
VNFIVYNLVVLRKNVKMFEGGLLFLGGCFCIGSLFVLLRLRLSVFRGLFLAILWIYRRGMLKM